MPSPSGLITLTTDFGDTWYVGAMKGAALEVNPRVRLVDITHGVPHADVLGGAFALAAAAPAFPRGAVHLVVVDPGVGTARQALVLETDGAFFVGPDNGVLTLAAPPAARSRATRIENGRYFRPDPSATFHGRDIFAPVAAHLTLGADPADLGPAAQAPVELSLPQAVRDAEGWAGEVLLADGFGNLITSIPADRLAGGGPAGDWPAGDWPAGDWEAWLGDRPIGPLRRTYGDADAGELLALPGSHGYLEIALSGGSAARAVGGLAAARAKKVRLRPRGEGTR